ncbi:hypothetical protein Gotri_019758 [Gossypium trilobum]|uniref:Uncharacterized protein n=1 Tax=Gossypium trilobum TaxID=34281 RepID=A0A7J9EE08_9ROSI|nr:hypothetical protein [Gossypium trilobum]MBA0771274.1 hypothetical protein [Gossypium trilobum]
MIISMLFIISEARKLNRRVLTLKRSNPLHDYSAIKKMSS